MKGIMDHRIAQETFVPTVFDNTQPRPRANPLNELQLETALESSDLEGAKELARKMYALWQGARFAAEMNADTMQQMRRELASLRAPQESPCG